MMKAARLHAVGKRLSVDSVEIPKIGAEDVLVDVRGAGICHSDIHYCNGVSPVGKFPITLGHEIAGVITETGGEAEGVEKGDRVLVHYVISCGNCNYCRTDREHYCGKYQMIGKSVDYNIPPAKAGRVKRAGKPLNRSGLVFIDRPG